MHSLAVLLHGLLGNQLEQVGGGRGGGVLRGGGGRGRGGGGSFVWFGGMRGKGVGCVAL